MLIVSDNESWHDTQRNAATATMREWAKLSARNPRAKLICIDLQPYLTGQTKAGAGILHVGGFSDAVFDLIAARIGRHEGLDGADRCDRVVGAAAGDCRGFSLRSCAPT